jgi:hypothetical protein
MVFAFAQEADAQRLLDVLAKRFAKYGLVLHPDKTRLVPFGRPRPGDEAHRADGSFDFLGFTHVWGQSRRGNWIVKRRTAKGRFGRALSRVGDWCRRHLHIPVGDQHRHLAQMLRGHYGYFGITGNADALGRFLYEVRRTWRKWLDRRTGRSCMPWSRFTRILVRFPLPPPKVVHSVYPSTANP